MQVDLSPKETITPSTVWTKNPEVMEDLSSSGLIATDMRIRQLDQSAMAACRVEMKAGTTVQGYVIPYYDSKGGLLPFYRVKLIKHDPKYRQPLNTPNHVYFPPNFPKALSTAKAKGDRYVILTEGEKKAAVACKHGIPAVALGGVDSWRSRSIILPGNTTITNITTANRDPKKAKKIRARLPSSGSSFEEELAQLAQGFDDLLEIVTQHGLTIVICFDSDEGATVKADVQRAAALLAYELRFLGVHGRHIRQLVLPDIGLPHHKTALDDYVVHKGAQSLEQLVVKAAANQKGFPRHPNPKAFINKILDNHPGRREAMQIGLAVLSDLDGRGRRLRDVNSGIPYYYSDLTHKLLPASFNQDKVTQLYETEFGQLLYNDYGLAGVDMKVLGWLASQFTGEEPIAQVVPRRFVCLTPEDHKNPDGIAFQISDSEYVSVSPSTREPLRLCVNGTNNILFEQGQIVPLDSHLIMQEFDKQNTVEKFTPWWNEILGTFAFKSINEARYAALLFYISPFLQRWRGIQLPVELVVGEAGSGKSSMYMLRLLIQTGKSILRNMPTDMKDWYAGIRNSGGLHVTDNVHFTDKQMRQKLSDEMCRLVTEPEPHVEMRKLYTNAEQFKIPVNVNFVVTAIQQPFHNSDLIQRSAIFQLEPRSGSPDGDWVRKQLEEYGGREAWVAHHLVFLHRWLKIACATKGGWDYNFKTVHRLAHYEQALTIAAKVTGEETSVWLPATLNETVETALSEADWTFEGLKYFLAERLMMFPKVRGGNWRASDIAEWAQQTDDFKENRQLTSSHRLGRYLGSHKAQIAKILGMRVIRIDHNRAEFEITVEGAEKLREWMGESPKGPKKVDLEKKRQERINGSTS